MGYDSRVGRVAGTFVGSIGGVTLHNPESGLVALKVVAKGMSDPATVVARAFCCRPA